MKISIDLKVKNSSRLKFFRILVVEEEYFIQIQFETENLTFFEFKLTNKQGFGMQPREHN